MRKKIIICFLSFCIFVSVLGAGHRFVICFGMKTYLENRLAKGGKVDFSYKELGWEEGYFVLHDISATQKKGESSLFSIKIDELKVAFHCQLFPFKFSSKVVMDHPQVNLVSREMRKSKSKKSLYDVLNKVLFKTAVKIEGGEFSFGDQMAYVTFETPEEGGKGILKLSQGKEETPLTATFLKEGKAVQLDIEFKNFDTAWAFEIGRFFFPEVEKEFLVKKGNLDGNIALALGPPHHIEYIKYAFDLKDLVVRHEGYGCDVSIRHFRSSEHITEGSHPFFEKVWPYFIGDSEMTGMHMVFEDPHMKHTWTAADVSGCFRFSHSDTPLMEFHGIFHRGKQEIPFHLKGEGAIKDDASWKVAFDARFFSEKEMEAHFALTSKGEKEFLVNLSYENLSPEPLALAQFLIGVKIPFLRKVHVNEGSFSGKGEVWIEDKEVKRCELTYFEGQNIEISMPEKCATGRGSLLRGKGEFDLSTPDFFDGSFWEASLVDGMVDLGNNQVAEKIEFSIAMHDQYLKPSSVSCHYRGIEGKVSFEGLYTHLNINVDMFFIPEGLSEPVAIDLDMKLKTLEGRLGVEGILAFLQGKEKSDAIEFGWNWDIASFLKGDYRSSLELGWFKGNNISSKTFNLPLILWDREFRGEGVIDIEGTFNAHALEFSIDPTNFSYESKDITIRSEPKRCEKSPNCNFSFDFERQGWRGKIPLREAWVKEHYFGIEFESFSSEVDLEGTEILFQNVDAFSGGIRFQAEIAIDFAKEDRNELKIDTYAIDGDVENMTAFLHHFEMFKELDLPLKGRIASGPGDMHLRAYVGDVQKLLEWKIALRLQEGTYLFSKDLGFENLAGDLYYSAEEELFKVEKVEGSLKLTAGKTPKSYSLNVPLLELDALEGVLKYDCRLEAPTYEICRIVGNGSRENKEFRLYFDREQTRFFGAAIDVNLLTFKEGSLARADLSTTLSALDLVHHLDFLSGAGLIPIKDETLHELRGPSSDGEVKVTLFCDQQEETLSFDIASSKLLIGPIDLDHLAIRGERKGDHFLIKDFDAGLLKAKVEMKKEGDLWKIPEFSLMWKKSYFKGGNGILNKDEKMFHLPLDGLKMDLEEITSLFPSSDFDWSYLGGTLFVDGALDFDFSRGFRNWAFDGEIQLVGENFGRGKLKLESPEKLHFSMTPFSGFVLKGADFNFFHPRSNQLWGKCHIDALSIHDKVVSGENVRVIIPPEMAHFLGQTHSLPHLDYEEERLIFCHFPLKWENQIEAALDFSIGEKISMQGQLKEGYYWIENQVWYLSECSFAFDHGALTLNINTLYDETPFDFNAQLSFYPHFTSRMVVQETCNEERSDHPLVIQSGWNDNEGFFIQSIDGQICGLDFSFHHNPRESFMDKMALKGQLKINAPKLSKILPKSIREGIKAFEIGRGYKLSGDLVISKTHFDESHFTGYLKGKHFELMGSVMETLMSEIDIRLSHIELDHFTISDVSGMFALDSIRVGIGSDDQWELVIPEAIITDFRPSLLKKIGKYPTRIKPLTIRNLTAQNIRGTLGDLSSFKGKGSLNFINTFKRDYHILDIPFEILGRLGLDMGLLVPVRGDLNFDIKEGGVYLTKLSGSYSEGKRSQFSLSRSKQSYIDFQGNIDINIKMKQYVLLKVTEPFTLSIGGTFEHPKYGLY